MNLQSIAFDAAAGMVQGTPAAVTEGPLRTIAPSLSPDGRWIAFIRTDKQEDLFVARVDGSGARQLTDDPARDRQPRWSPDGSRIAFYSNRGGKYQIWTIRPDGGEMQQITFVETAQRCIRCGRPTAPGSLIPSKGTDRVPHRSAYSVEPADPGTTASLGEHGELV